ncbi:MAG: pyridoxamine 5'-phosphate oxidase family protein [Selenomonas sp.]|uniref:pyridoxamine 5'-phosphate oxidase family protein n=1 Tax=Selenomonas sp. TaxID=2053611 RepID=UPI0025ECB3B6|nr:pyridoxamine 5'-phosphate oxidase family protein [Selenomonas sp.]MCR5757449.1 pyridoxamine 5'-phosphate oxidase family protein [Selenomonas sp.]
MISENVKKVFAENPWFIATHGNELNVVPVGFKHITEDGKFAIGAVLLDTTLENIKKNGQIAIAVANPTTAESYQVKGKAELCQEGAAYEQYAKLAEETFKGAHPVKCAILVTPEKLIVATPNSRNREELPL